MGKLIDNLLKEKDLNISLGTDILFFHANNFNCLGGKQNSGICANLCNSLIDTELSILFCQRLSKEFQSIMLLFSISDYRSVCRSLRYIFDDMARTYYMDTKYRHEAYKSKYEKFGYVFGGYLFSWDDIPGKDDGRLKESLIQNYPPPPDDPTDSWIRTANIEKIDNGKTISVSNDCNRLLMTVNSKDPEKVVVDIKGSEKGKFNAKMENGKLNIYSKKILIGMT